MAYILMSNRGILLKPTRDFTSSCIYFMATDLVPIYSTSSYIHFLFLLIMYCFWEISKKQSLHWNFGCSVRTCSFISRGSLLPSSFQPRKCIRCSFNYFIYQPTSPHVIAAWHSYSNNNFRSHQVSNMLKSECDKN